MSNNDRFKFRAWDERTKTCFDNAMIETLAPISTWVKNGWVVEQCTGLKDENGKLIYEGDILFHPYFEKGMVVRFNKLHLYFGMQAVHNPLIWMPLFPGVDGVFRIIGNIHENHELLEEKK